MCASDDVPMKFYRENGTNSGHNFFVRSPFTPPSCPLSLMQTTQNKKSIQRANMTSDPNHMLFPFVSNSIRFPVKLHQLLEAAENDTWLAGIISWVPDGDHGFLVHHVEKFERQILRSVFPSMKAFSSFRRQLNLYGIRKSTPGGKRKTPLLYRTHLGIEVRTSLLTEIVSTLLRTTSSIRT